MSEGVTLLLQLLLSGGITMTELGKRIEYLQLRGLSEPTQGAFRGFALRGSVLPSSGLGVLLPFLSRKGLAGFTIEPL